MGEKKNYVQKMGKPKIEKQPIFLKNTKMGTFQKKWPRWTMDGHQKSPTKKNRHFVKKNRFTDVRGTKKDVMKFSTVWSCSLKIR